MAVIQFGTIVTDIKGKVGGHTFKGSLGGAVLQTNAVHKRSAASSSATLNQRALNPNNIALIDAVVYCAKFWKSLTPAQKAAWVAAAPNFPTTNALGKPSKPSGYHCFLHINIRLYFTSSVILTAPPANQVGVVPLLFTISTITISAVTINLPSAVPAGYMCYIKATKPMSAGIKPSQSMFRIINYLAAGVSGSVANITQYQGTFGKPVSGQTIWLETVLSNLTTGLLGQPYLQAFVVI